VPGQYINYPAIKYGVVKRLRATSAPDDRIVATCSNCGNYNYNFVPFLPMKYHNEHSPVRSVMSSGGGNTPSASSETTAVLAVVQSLLDAIPSKNATKLLANCHPSGCCARMRGMDIQFGTIKDLADSIASLPGEVEDRFIDPEVKGTGT